MRDSSVIIEANGIGKRFQLGQFISMASSLRAVKRIATHPLSLFRKPTLGVPGSRIQRSGDASYFWGLRKVDLEVRRGETVAILGRNGAGKSTLLKVLVGIMAPTEGKVVRHGRLVPLMGVGAGFNLELTGRENVFLNAAVLGLSPSEVRDRYDNIVAFAEIPDFMDTPVKRFSKGMRARLGISIAINLAPDVLVVDEVLAVGDLRFRQKCMDTMRTMCAQGMTLLFVSHSPARVRALCERSVLIRDGVVIDDGPTERVLQRYLDEDIGGDTVEDGDADDVAQDAPREARRYLSRMVWPLEDAPGDEVVKITDVRILNEAGNECDTFSVKDPIILQMTYAVLEDSSALRPQFQVFTETLEVLFGVIDTDDHWRSNERPVGIYRTQVIIPGNLLAPSTLVVGASVYRHRPTLIKHARTADCASFKVVEHHSLDTAQSDYPRPMPGAIRPLLNWSTTILDDDTLVKDNQLLDVD